MNSSGLGAAISDRHLAIISRDHVTNWESLVPFLGLTRAQEQAVARSSPGDYEKQKRECLMKWREAKGARATYQALISVAEEAGNQQLADSVREISAQQ